MNIHEYQAKQIFAKYGVPTPRGIVANTKPRSMRAAAVSAAASSWHARWTKSANLLPRFSG